MSGQDHRPLGFATRAIHALPALVRIASQAIAAPLFQTASFGFAQNDDIAAALEGDGLGGHVYSRLSNPNVSTVECAVADLEGAQAGLGLASGMAAVHAVAVSLAKSGDHIVAPSSMYGGSFGLFSRVLPRLGISASLVRTGDVDAYAAAITSRTRFLYAETITNPTLDVAPLPALAELAHKRGLLLVVDSTFASPYLCRPIEHGADVVLHSASKYLGGHGDLIAGVVVGSQAVIEAMRHLSDDLGGTMAPFVAWLIQRGLKTLALRMVRHSSSAAFIAHKLAGHPRLTRVVYPGLDRHPQHALAKTLLAPGFGGMMAIEVEGDRANCSRVMDKLRIFARAPSLGDTAALAIQPAATSHRQLDPAQLRAAGISEGFIRLSIGLEEPEDLLADLEQALS